MTDVTNAVALRIAFSFCLFSTSNILFRVPSALSTYLPQTIRTPQWSLDLARYVTCLLSGSLMYHSLPFLLPHNEHISAPYIPERPTCSARQRDASWLKRAYCLLRRQSRAPLFRLIVLWLSVTSSGKVRHSSWILVNRRKGIAKLRRLRVSLRTALWRPFRNSLIHRVEMLVITRRCRPPTHPHLDYSPSHYHYCRQIPRQTCTTQVSMFG